MPFEIQQTYKLIWDHEHQFAARLAEQVVEKPRLTIWRIIVPVLLIYHARKIQEYKADLKTFSKGFLRTKILAMESALEEIVTGKKDDEYTGAFALADTGDSPNEKQLRSLQIAEVQLLKAHYKKLLGIEADSFQDLIKKTYKTSGEYRRFLARLAKAEDAVQQGVLHVYQPSLLAQSVAKKMQQAAKVLRDEEVKNIFR